MRIGINGAFWSQENTGSGQYTRQLWQSLAQLPAEPVDEPVSYELLGYAPLLTMPDVPDDQKKLAVVPELVKRGGDNGVKLWWEQRGLPQLVGQAQQAGQPFDVIHWPYFAASLQAPPAPCATIITIHDLIPLVLPEYAPSLPLKLYFRLVSRAARQATLILADSEKSRQDILRLLKVPENRVETVYLGTDGRFRPNLITPEERTALLQKYGLDGPERVILYIGGFDQRKNVPMLIKAFGQALPHLKALEATEVDNHRPWTLVLAGSAHSDNSVMYPDLKEPARQAVPPGDENRIRFLGRFEEADKAALYSAADLFVFPSRYEGFGLPPLEAMGCGIPTLCSNVSSLPELVGDAAMTADPDRVEDWVAGIVELAASPSKRADLAARGPTQAARFTWEKTAERTLQLYHAAECIKTRGKN